MQKTVQWHPFYLRRHRCNRTQFYLPNNHYDVTRFVRSEYTKKAALTIKKTEG